MQYDTHSIDISNYGSSISVGEYMQDLDADTVRSIIEGNQIYIDENAGGTSKVSEAMSYEILKRIFGSDLSLHLTENNVRYNYDCSGVVHVDYVCRFCEKFVIVSVTRVTNFEQTVNNLNKHMTIDDVKSRLIHKFTGFSNVRVEDSHVVSESFEHESLGKITVQTVPEKKSYDTNIIFVWTENEQFRNVMSVLSDDEVIAEMKDKNIIAVVVPTNSPFIIYEDPTVSSISEYYAKKNKSFNDKRSLIALMRNQRAIAKQFGAWYSIYRAIRCASSHIVSLSPKRKTLEKIKTDGFCVLYKWIFRPGKTPDPDGIFRNYYISNLIYIDKYTESMKLIDKEIKKSIVDELYDYYNKRGKKITIRYVKGKKYNISSHRTELYGALVAVPEDSDIELGDYVFYF